MQLVLASGSPRRKQLLEQLDISFVVETPEIDETANPGESADAYVKRLSAAKAEVVLARLDPGPAAVVLAADTTVVNEGNILGKPTSKKDGIDMLMSLSGKRHDVLTGVTVCSEQHTDTFSVSTSVKFCEVSIAEAEWYWRTGEPQDKAGGYGLQGIGAVFVESLSGCYSNVIGLPLSKTVSVLKQYGVDCVGNTGAITK